MEMSLTLGAEAKRHLAKQSRSSDPKTFFLHRQVGCLAVIKKQAGQKGPMKEEIRKDKAHDNQATHSRDEDEGLDSDMTEGSSQIQNFPTANVLREGNVNAKVRDETNDNSVSPSAGVISDIAKFPEEG